MTPQPVPKAPTYLRTATRKWFHWVVTSYELDPHHVRLLILACEAWDRCQSARETLADKGAFYTSKSGEPRRHPANDVARDATIAFARIIRELDLDTTQSPESARPPSLRSIRRGA
jgi:P27 family predicted phage terminase small subunit